MSLLLRVGVLVGVVLAVVLASAGGILIAVNGSHRQVSALEVEGEHEPTV